MARGPALALAAEQPLLPAPGAFGACCLVGLAIVLLAPELARGLPRPATTRPHGPELAVSSAAVLALTVGYLYAARRAMRLTWAWLGLAAGYNAVIVVVKFVLSPAAFQASTGTSLGEYVWVGLVVMLLYAAGLGAVYAVAGRARPHPWAWSSKAALVAALVVFAVGSRFVVAMVLGGTASGYLRRVFAGAGLWLPVLLALACVLAVEAFDQAARPGDGDTAVSALHATLRIGLALVFVYHALWVVLMLRLF